MHGGGDGGGGALHRGLDEHGVDRGWHRADDGHRPGESTCALGRRRPRSEEPPDRGRVTRPRLLRCGPTPPPLPPSDEIAEPAGSVGGPAPSSSSSSAVVGSLMSVTGRSGDAWGPARCDAPHRRAPQRLDGVHRVPGDGSDGGLPHARGGRPAPRQREHPRGPVRQVGLDAPGALPQQRRHPQPRISEMETGNLPWQQPPTWMYLPHLGIGCGSTVTSATAADNMGGHADDEHEAGPPQQHADRGQSPRRDPIRGRVGSGLQPPGPVYSCHAPAAPRDGQIRGRTAPGTANGRSAAEARAEARLAAQHAPLRRSLEDHAERVAKRQRCGDTPNQPSPAARLAAVRARVAARVEQARSTPTGSGGDAISADDGAAVDSAVAHAASRAAHHGVAPSTAD